MYAVGRSTVNCSTCEVELVSNPSPFFMFISPVVQDMLWIPIAAYVVDNGQKDSARMPASRDSRSIGLCVLA